MKIGLANFANFWKISPNFQYHKFKKLNKLN